jgi:hypothetical protein
VPRFKDHTLGVNIAGIRVPSKVKELKARKVRLSASIPSQ